MKDSERFRRWLYLVANRYCNQAHRYRMTSQKKDYVVCCCDLRKFAREMSLEEMLTSDNDLVRFLGEQLLQADHIISLFNKYQKWGFS